MQRIRLAVLAAILLSSVAVSAQPLVEELKSDLYGSDTSRRSRAAAELLRQYPQEALAEFGRILRTPAAPFNEKWQLELCTMLARRGDAESIELVLRKSKENSDRALWISEEALAQARNLTAISALVPGLLTSLRAADRELGFFLAGKHGLTERRDVFVKALAHEENDAAFDQAVASAELLSKKGRIAGLLLDQLSIVPSLDRRLAIAAVVGRSGDTSVVSTLTKMLNATETRPVALMALAQMHREEGLKAAMASLTPAPEEESSTVPRDRARTVALDAILLFPRERIREVIPQLLMPEAAFAREAEGGPIDSRLYLLEWMRAHPDSGWTTALRTQLASEPSLRHREALLRALAAIRDPDSTPLLEAAASEGDPAALVALADSGAPTAEQTALSKLEAVLAAGLDTNPALASAAIQALGRFSSKSAVDALARVAALNLDPYSIEALKQLGAMSTAESQQVLIDALKSPVSEVRRAACIVLGAHGTPASLRILEALQRTDKSEAVRQEAARAAASIRARSGKPRP